MDQCKAMQVFLAVADSKSFTQAAEQLVAASGRQWVDATPPIAATG